MDTWSEDSWPRTLRYCKVCQKETTHETRAGASVIARICAECLARALKYALARD
jgi:hypothetical protein